jgi:SAM-dependent methyltransferase
MATEGWSEGYVTDVAYTSNFYRDLSPVLLCHLGFLKSIQAPRVEAPFTFMELGCGHGLTTNVLAAVNPTGRFYAVDFNPLHVLEARTLAEEAGLANVTFLEESFADLGGADLPDFDFIVLHGVWSWVNAENREHILRFIARRLRPGGIAYVSYNCMPGWAPIVPLRRLLLEQGGGRGESTARVSEALTLAQRLQTIGAGYFQATPGLKDHLSELTGMAPNYLAHEYLNESWAPFHFVDVARDMARAKLSYVGSADLFESIDHLSANEQARKLLEGVPDASMRELVKDFLVNQKFRRDVYVKGARPLHEAERRSLFQQTRYALTTPLSRVKYEMPAPVGRFVLTEELYRPLVEALAEGPQSPGQLAGRPAIGKLGMRRLTQMMHILCASRQVWAVPTRPADGAPANRVNHAILRRAVQQAYLPALASPVAATGLSLAHTDQLLLLGHQRKETDLPRFVLSVLSSRGERLSREGRVLETEEESLRELQTLAKDFSDQLLPVLRQLGIAS